MANPKVTLPVAQFAQRLKQANPQYASMPDEQLVAAFLSKNSKYQGNYEDSKLISVSFEPSAAASRGQQSGGSLPVQSQSNRIAAHAETHSAAPTSPAAPMQSLAQGPTVKQTVSGETTVPSKTTVVRPEPAAPAPGTDSTFSAQDIRTSAPSSVGQPDLRTTVVVNAEASVRQQMVGKYQIIEQLGQGGMGTVYKAFDPGIGRTVALKLMSQQLAQDSEFLSRFLREARAAGILQHPNIVVIHELGEWQGAPFIAMEFLEGRSLGDILKNEKDMPLERRLDIVAQVCRGLDYAHARGIVHRDIKPANVMVTEHGVAKIVDFGIARLADQKLTQTGHVLGTVAYMSPEQLQGRTPDGRSDIFAVGIMLFEALTSVLPFPAENTASAIANILYRQPLKLSSFLANYPGDLDEIIAKCLAKDASDRFQTAGELGDRISQVQHRIQVSQSAPTVIRPASLPTSATSQPFAASPNVAAAPPITQTATPSASLGAVSQQVEQVASKSASFAKQWWRFASPKARRNLITVGAAAVLYLIAIQLVAVPVAILAAMMLAAQAPFVRKWWASATVSLQVAIGLLAIAVAAFCFSKLAVGVMWYISFSENHVMAILVAAVVAIAVGVNVGSAAEWWKSSSGKSRVIGCAVGLLMVTCIVVSVRDWSPTPKSYFASGGEYEQNEKAGAAILQKQGEAYAAAPYGVWTDSSFLSLFLIYKPKLMWMNKDNGKHVTWVEAQDFCRASRIGGYSDWRLPTVEELKKIYEGKREFDEKPGIYHIKKGIFLSDTTVWSSTQGVGFDFQYAENMFGTRALCVRVDNGRAPAPISHAQPASPEGQVLPGAADASSHGQSTPLAPSLAGVWTDSETGLMWQSESGQSDRTWPQADSYCRDLRLAGFSDWRLATLNELESVYPHTLSGGGRDVQPSSMAIWSSEQTPDSRHAWYFYFMDARRFSLAVNDSSHGVRALCVRGTFNGHFHSIAGEAAERQRQERAIDSQQRNAYVSATQGVWSDPSVNALMWMSKDNGRDIKWIDAESFCRASRVSGYSDWRLPTLDELKGIYDGKPNLQNVGSGYHVKKGIFLSGAYVWSSQEVTPLNFVYGVPASTGGSSYGARALCVRRVN